MVISPDNPTVDISPAPPPSTQTNLHNFSFPILKTWGSQRVLRCLSVNRNGETIKSISRSPEPAEVASSPPPWNLRTRRSPAVRDPDHSPSPPPRPREEHVARTVRLRSEDAAVEKKEVRPRAMFTVSLSRDEIDEDFYSLTGSRARRRPKKRPRAVEKKLNSLFPGSWLGEVTVESYKVPD